MLYKVGPISIDTRPFNADSVSRDASADIARKPTIGGLKPKEFMGQGDDNLRLSGQLLPTKIGGLSELGAIDSFRLSGTPLPVVRGDGVSLGWYMITGLSERHNDLMANGVGFVVRYNLKLTKSSPNASSFELVSTIISIFDISGG